MTTADNAVEQEIPEGQAPPSQEDSTPETEADAREREVQRRLTQQGREAAEARRQAAAATQALAAQTTRLTELEAGIRLLTANLSERDKRDAESRKQQMQAELASLPPADRLQRQIELLQGEMAEMRTAAQPAQPARRTPPQQPQQPPVRQASDDERRAYMEQRVSEIVSEAQRTYGVRPNLDHIPDEAWGTEEAFYAAAMRQARDGAGGNNVVSKQDETPAQMRERIRQEERERLGATSPAAPRAASTGGRKKAASADDVRSAAQAYDSKLGPKANIERMKRLREGMG
jgi:hypothetical protein